MKASVVSAYGGPEVMKYQDMPDPEPGAGDVLVKVAGIGINPEDMLERNGDLKDRWPMHATSCASRPAPRQRISTPMPTRWPAMRLPHWPTRRVAR